jgi:hypothetical protein
MRPRTGTASHRVVRAVDLSFQLGEAHPAYGRRGPVLIHILTQLTSIEAAFDKVARLLLDDRVGHCVGDAAW